MQDVLNENTREVDEGRKDHISPHSLLDSLENETRLILGMDIIYLVALRPMLQKLLMDVRSATVVGGVP